jgi:hypothetical protein
VTKEFILKVTPFYGQDNTVTASQVERVLARATSQRLDFSIDSVEDYYHFAPPAIQEWMPGKITAIKRVRDVLKCSLRDAKFLIDTADTVGVVRWANITIYTRTHNGAPEFQVLTSANDPAQDTYEYNYFPAPNEYHARHEKD